MSKFEYAPAPESRSIVDIKSSYGLFIDGRFVEGHGTPFETINPATGVMDTRHLASLVDQPRPTGELPFGVDAEVLVAGDVAVGQPVSVMPS